MDLEILRVLGVHHGVAVDQHAVAGVAFYAVDRLLGRIVPVDVGLASRACAPAPTHF